MASLSSLPSPIDPTTLDASVPHPAVTLLQVQALGLSDLHKVAPSPVVSLRQAVVNAFACLLSTGTSALCAPLPCSSQNLPEPSAVPHHATASADFLCALRFLASHVLRAPPPTLPEPFAISCMLQLCEPWAPDDPAERRAMLRAFTSAVDLSHCGAGRRTGAGEGGGALSPLLAALTKAQLYEAASALHWRLGHVTAALEGGLRHCKATADLAADFAALESAGEVPANEVALRRSSLRHVAAMLVDIPPSSYDGDAVAGTRGESGVAERRRVAQDRAALVAVLMRMLDVWLDSVEPLLAGGWRSGDVEQGVTAEATCVFSQHFTFLCTLQDSLLGSSNVFDPRCAPLATPSIPTMASQVSGRLQPCPPT
jgi:hypothetical protein